MSMADILFHCEAGVATVTLNRPQARNALTGEMVEAFIAFLHRIEADEQVRCIVLRGAGEHFMAGGDVKSFAEAADLAPEARRAMFEGRVQRVAPLLLLLERVPQVVVACVKGAVAGAGLSFVAAADLAIAGAGSFFLLAQIKLGLTPDGSSTFYLPRELGLKRAKEIALLGDRFDAAQAERWGLVNRVVPDDAVDAEVAMLAARLAAGPGLAQARTKQLLQQSLQQGLAAQLQSEAQAFAACTAHPDFVAGLQAFIERRPARFGEAGQPPAKKDRS
jgi:2-(1,2-epoxy-1,2-dihydrophenyl)acetyl-CoA isomerase